MGKHTPEPWVVTHDWVLLGLYSGNCVEGAGNRPVLYHNAYEGFSIQKPDVDRAVACVNALANIPDPAAYIKAMREAYEAATAVRDRLAERSSVYWTDKESLELDAKLKALRTLSTPESEVKRGSSQAALDSSVSDSRPREH
jgi:hypothetical protein